MVSPVSSYKHLYVHVPFCRRRCSYCDFSIAVRRSVPSERFVDAIVAELALRDRDGSVGRSSLDTLYIGGGTPSLLCQSQLIRLIDSIRRTCGKDESLNITLEANPDDVDVSVARAWHEMGISRVSLGVQSLHAETLAWMHRTHTEYDSLRALDALQVADIDSISADVIFGLPEHLDADPAADAETLACHGVSHLSAYGLTLEPHTAVAKWKVGGASVLSDEEPYACQFVAIHDRLSAQGFEHYEISNYARPAHRSAHNLGYWNGESFLGVGPAAHSHANGERWWNVRPWAEYDGIMEGAGDPIAGRESLDESQRWLETVYLGLRTDLGLRAVNARRLPAEDLRRLVDRGYLAVDEEGSVRATLDGWLCLDEVVSVLTTSGEGG